MARVWTTLVVLVMACLVAVSVASAQEKKEKGKRPDPAARWAAIAKAAEKEGATELTKDEFVKGLKAGGGRMADRAEELFKQIKKADEKKVTKDEFVTFMKEFRGKKKGDNK